MFSHFLRKIGAVVGWAARSRPPTVTTADGLVWEVEPAADTLFGVDGPVPAAWRSSGRMAIVKENAQRTIARVELPGGSVYVKHCRIKTPRAWAREILRPAKARLEFENARLLRDRGVAAIEPLAWGAASHLLPGDSYLITRAQDGAVPFLDVLETSFATTAVAGRRELTRGFAAFVAGLHDAGVVHPDPHPGNFLVEFLSPGTPRFFLADLHAIRFGPPLPWADARANLIVLNRWFQLRATRAVRLRFWLAYVATRRVGGPTDAAALAKDLERATEESNNRFWTARTARYTGNNRDSKRVRGSAASGFAVRDLPPDVVRDWLADPDAVFSRPGVVMLKDSRSSTVAELTVESPTGPRAVVYKRLRLKSWVGVTKNLFRPPPALRSWVVGNGVRDRGLPTARPLAYFQRTRFGMPLTGYLVCDKVPAALELSEAVAALDALAPDARRRVARDWAERLGRLVRLMHDRQVSHRDLKAPNILMAGAATHLATAEPVLIDLVGVTAGKPVPDAVRAAEIGRLSASFYGSPRVTRSDRLRFLRAYLGWNLHGRGDWKRWWVVVDTATRVKVAKNERTGRPLA
ncbi:lipopolysaccharide kinase InaA family protein [Fimbriiglobus ruber]|uniref:Serine/threonine protein kinase n=1 Tax=Fimbriiglobus ruber TaxID=1908690 RepID=A0A225E444_9BACT|nr:lipopolysaccharide kinase InaA family protein [Fimbriiglobus ruber]OWK43455.1 Serine/threonine protein kinase [Fimbriiglobus ruber]